MDIRTKIESHEVAGANANRFALRLGRNQASQRRGEENGKQDHYSRMQGSFTHISQISL